MSDREAIVQRFHPEVGFGGFSDIDATIRFYARVQEVLRPDSVALDVGCGRGTQAEDPVRTRRELRILRGKCARVIGIDLDPAAAGNVFIDEFRLIGDDHRWPVRTGSIDVVLADFVVEHVSDPDAFFAEAARVLRSGGVLCVRTVNAASYLGLISRLVPMALHARVLARAHPGRREQDIFPTAYRANTLKALGGAMKRHEFDAVVYGVESEPTYLSFSGLGYRLGILYGRAAPSRLRSGLFAWGRRR